MQEKTTKNSITVPSPNLTTKCTGRARYLLSFKSCGSQEEEAIEQRDKLNYEAGLTEPQPNPQRTPEPYDSLVLSPSEPNFSDLYMSSMISHWMWIAKEGCAFEQGITL